MSIMEKQQEDTKLPVADSKKEPEIRYRIRPTRYVNYDCANKSWDLEFHLPGVKKEDIDLKFINNAYRIKARRDQALYQASEYLPFDINEESIEAKYNNGLLYVKGKIKDPMEEAVEIKLT